ncbi:cell division protein FtsZ [Rickettsiales bacterium LUAb2]
MIKRFTSIEEVKLMKSDKQDVFTPNIAIIGIGGAGANAINNLINMNLSGVKFIVANTDVKSLDNSLSPNKIRLGLEITKGLGAGSKPDVGFQAAEESINEIREELEDVDLLFIIAGMGGGTGTGSSQVIAKVAKDLDILTLGFVTKPFTFEGKQRMDFAEEGIIELKKYIDSLVVISNQNLFKVINENTSMLEAFRIMDNVIHSGVKAITDLIISNGMVNLDFNDIKSVIKGGGRATVTSIEVSGSDRVNKITDAVVNNPLVDNNISLLHAKNILINVTGGVNMTLFEVDKIVNSLRDKASLDTYINFGAIFDEKMAESIRVAIVATGIEEAEFNNISEEVFNKNINRNVNYKANEVSREELASSMMQPTKKIEKPVVKKVLSKEEQAFNQVRANSYINNQEDDDNEDYNEDTSNNLTEEKISSVTKKGNLKKSINDEDISVQLSSKSDNSSLFSLIEDNQEDDEDEEETEQSYKNKSNLMNLSKKAIEEFSNEENNKAKNSKSFFELPPFLRQKK